MNKIIKIALTVLGIFTGAALLYAGFWIGRTGWGLAGTEPGFGMMSGGGMMGNGMMGQGMMVGHMTNIPQEYQNLTNPIPADEESLARGQELYTNLCATCHGETGLGDGPGGTALDPAPAPIAYTSQMVSDGYLFWRISEGGVPFGTGMPAWGTSLDEQARWDLIHFVKSLNNGH